MAKIDLSELRKEIDRDEKLLNEKRELYDGLRKYLRTKSKFSEYTSEDEPEKTLREKIEEVLPSLGKHDFSNADVEELIGIEGIRPRITMELKKLEEIGKVNCISVGQGRSPSVFKVK